MRQDNSVVRYRRKANSKKTGKAFVGLVGLFVALALLAYYLASPLSLLDGIEIDGVRQLKPDEVMDLAGLEQGLHYWRLKTSRCRDKLLASPWVAEASIRRKLPNSLVVTLVERQGIAVLGGDGGNWVVAEDGMILAESQGFSLPWLTGLTPEGSLASGKYVGGKDIDAALTWATAFLPLAGQISELNFDAPVMVSVFTNDGYKALFNWAADPGERVRDFIQLVGQLRTTGQKGIIDFRGSQGKGVFKPWPGPDH